MKVGIYTHPRSGSSMLYSIMVEHYEWGWGKDSVFPLSECLNATGAFSIIEESKRLAVDHHKQRLPERQIQSRAERFALLKKYHHQNYLIKVFGGHVHEEEIRKYLIEHYSFVALERKDSFDAVLSGIIATEYLFYNNWEGEDLSLFYRPFIAKYDHFDYMVRSLTSYYKYKSQFNITKTLVYEDIVNLDRSAILAELGLPPNPDPTLPLQKLHSFEDKVKLIENYDEVLDWYNTKLKFRLPENRGSNHGEP